MKIDFRTVEIFTNVAKTQCVVQDIREAFADMIYNQGTGIKSYALALNIYNSNGDDEWTDEEVSMIEAYANMCTPAYMEAIKKLIGKAV